VSDGVRTRDLHLGKVPRYRLRHTHMYCITASLSTGSNR
jgi:hypothetical protein